MHIRTLEMVAQIQATSKAIASLKRHKRQLAVFLQIGYVEIVILHFKSGSNLVRRPIDLGWTCQ